MKSSLQVTFLDVGQGDAIVIILPDKKSCILIDTPSVIGARRLVIDYLKEKNIETIELALITHSDADHSGLADLITEIIDQSSEFNIDVKRFSFLPDRKKINTGKYRILLNQVKSFKEYGIKPWMPTAGSSLKIDGVGIEAIYPDMYDVSSALLTQKDSNNSSTIIKILYADVIVLLGGDLEGEGWSSIIENNTSIKCDILKLPHHGAQIEPVDEFNYNKLINLTDPKYAIISVGTRNKYNHPSKEVIKIIRNNNSNTHIMCTQVSDLCMDRNKNINIYRNQINKFNYKFSLALTDETRCACCGSISFWIYNDGNISTDPSIKTLENIKSIFEKCKCL